MATITLDTLAFVKQMKSAGFTDSQAEAQARAINQVLSDFQTSQLNEPATRADLLTAKAELQSEIAKTNTQIARTKSEIIKWVSGMLVAQAAVAATLVKLL